MRPNCFTKPDGIGTRPLCQIWCTNPRALTALVQATPSAIREHRRTQRCPLPRKTAPHIRLESDESSHAPSDDSERPPVTMFCQRASKCPQSPYAHPRPKNRNAVAVYHISYALACVGSPRVRRYPNCPRLTPPGRSRGRYVAEKHFWRFSYINVRGHVLLLIRLHLECISDKAPKTRLADVV